MHLDLRVGSDREDLVLLGLAGEESSGQIQMKGITLSFVFFLLFVGSLIVLSKLRLVRCDKSLYGSFGISLIFVGFYFAVYQGVPDNLYIYDERYLETDSSIDVFNGAVLFTLAAIGFSDFLVAAVIQPFSADMLVHIHHAGSDGLTFEGLLGKYTGGEGVDTGLGKRVNYLLENGYIEKLGDQMTITNKGAFIAKCASYLSRLS